MGQFLGVVVAETEAQAREAAKLVACAYEDLPARGALPSLSLPLRLERERALDKAARVRVAAVG